jgi:cytochrome P450
MSKPVKSLFDPEVIKCPYPTYEEMRRERPVAYMPELKAYFISRYDLVKSILADRRYEKGSAEKDGRKFVVPSDAAKKILLEDAEIGLPIHCLAESSGKIHLAYRQLADPFVNRKGAAAIKQIIEAYASRLLDTIAKAGECDVVTEFSSPFAVSVISDLIGFPDSLRPSIKAYADAALTYLTYVVPEEQAVAGARMMVKMHGIVRQLAAERRREPKEDILSSLANATIEGRPLSEKEICYIVEELTVGGNETTANAINNGLVFLAQHPELQAQLRAQPDQIGSFVEEVLRLYPPINSAHRFTTEDVEIEGVKISKGTKLYLGTASANRDEAKFACPADYNPQRKELMQQVTFGGGEHFCLGANLSKLEQNVAYAGWLKRFSSIELAQPVDSIEYYNTFASRAPISVKVRVRSA